jgi:hypothetical protein
MRSRVPVTLALLTMLLASPAVAQTQFEWRAGERPVRELRTDRLDRLDAARDRMTRRLSRTADRVRSRVSRALDRVHDRLERRSARLANRLHDRWHRYDHRRHLHRY